MTTKHATKMARPILAVAIILMLTMLSLTALAATATLMDSYGAGMVSIYSQPNYGTSVIAQLPVGTAITINGVSNGWYNITAGSISGYVDGSYVAFSDDVITGPGPVTATTPPVLATVTVANGPLNVHSAATLRAPVIAQLSTGQRVQLSHYDSNWAEVILSEGHLGYVVTSYLNFGAPVPTQSAPPIVATVTVADGPLNVHSAATLRAPVITQLATGAHVQLASFDNEWAEVILSGGRTGFVVTSYLNFGANPPRPTATPRPGTTDAPEHETAETEGANATVTTANHGPLHLRTQPDFDATIINTYANGSRIQVLSKLGNWYYVRAGSHVGYMDAEFITLDAGAGDLIECTGVDAVVQNPGSNEVLHLRAHPDMESDSLGEYHNGTYVEVRIVGEEWHYVVVDGLAGYMKSEFVHITDPFVTATSEITGDEGGYVSLYTLASPNSAILASIPVGGTVTVIAPDAEWSEVDYLQDDIMHRGYVATNALKMVKPDVTEMTISSDEG